MSQTKYSLPEDLRMRCLSFVKGYDRLVDLYHERRSDVMYGSPKHSGTGKNHYISDPTATKAMRLEWIEQMFDTKAMRAVEQAKLCIGEHLPDEQREMLTNLIWECCIEGRRFSYELRRGGLGYEKSQFYELRAKFVYNIAKNMGFI